MGKVPPAFVTARLGLLLKGCFMPFHLSLLGLPEQRESRSSPTILPPGVLASCLVLQPPGLQPGGAGPLGARKKGTAFGCLSYYRIFLQEYNSIHLTIKCRLAVIPG